MMKRQSLRVGVVVLLALLVLLTLERFGPDENRPPILDDSLRVARVLNKSREFTSGIEFQGVLPTMNDAPMTVSSLIGKKVVLLVFWSSSCVECYQKWETAENWQREYNDSGLSVIGVHVPEFAFHRTPESLSKTLDDWKISIPVVADVEGRTAEVYSAKKFPFFVVLDTDGFIRFTGSGAEGAGLAEEVFRGVLVEHAELQGTKTTLPARAPEQVVNPFDAAKSKNLYLGSEYGRKDFGNPQGLRQGFVMNYTLPITPTAMKAYVSGEWRANADNVELEGVAGQLFVVSDARKISLIAGSRENSTVSVFVDEILSHKFSVKEFKIYDVLELQSYSVHEVRLDIESQGMFLYKLALQ